MSPEERERLIGIAKQYADSGNAQKAADILRTVKAQEGGISPLRQLANDLSAMAGQGATLGWSDEILAGARYLMDRGQTPYGTLLAEERAPIAGARERRPIASTLAEMAGGMTLPAATSFGFVQSAPSVGNALIRGGLAGATEGMLYGAGAADTGRRAEGAVAGSVLGGLFGSMLPPVTQAGSNMFRRPANRAALQIREKLGQEFPLTDDPVLAARQSLSQQAMSDKPLTLADLGDSMQDLARAANTIGGPGRYTVRTALERRYRGTGARMADDVEKMLARNTDYVTRFDDLIAAQKAAADPAYAMLRKSSPVPAREFADLARSNAYKKASKRAEKTFSDYWVAEGMPEQAWREDMLSFEQVDWIKQQLDRQILKAKGSELRNLTKIKNRLTDKAEELFPGYAEARSLYAGPEKAKEYMKLGRKAINESPTDLRQLVNSLDSGQRQNFQLGYATALKDRIETSGSYNPANVLLNSQSKKLDIVFGDAAAEFKDALQAEKRMAETSSRALYGSQTADKRQDINLPTGSEAAGAARGSLLEQATIRLWDAMAGAITQRRRAENAREIADVLMKDPAQAQQWLQALQSMPPSATGAAVGAAAVPSGVIGALNALGQ